MVAVVRDVDRGYNRLLSRVLRPHSTITIGIHSDEGSAQTESGATVADVATVHEFGLGNHPQRSFIRAWFDANKSEHQVALRKIGDAVVRGNTLPSIAAERAALLLENSAKGFIQGGNVTPATDKDGTTLIDTGQLVTSIRGKVER